MINLDKRIYSNDFLKELKLHLNSLEKYITYPKFVFLCGRAYKNDQGVEDYKSSNRGLIENLLSVKSKNIFFVLSEELWEESFNSRIDLLTFEDFLADVSDSIILFVESPGTFAELGAFAYANNLFGEKLIVIIDKKYEFDKSFIITGPVAKVKKQKATIVFTPNFRGDLMACAELRKIIDNKVKEFESKNAKVNKCKPNIHNDTVVLKVFIVEILELIYILQPINRIDLINIYKNIKGFEKFEFVKKNNDSFCNEIRVEYILKLLTNVKLIKMQNDIIQSDNYEIYEEFLFGYGKALRNRVRNKLLSRKYKYKEI